VWSAIAAIAAGFGLGIFVSIFVGIAAQASGGSLTNPSPAVALIGDFLFDLSFVAAAAFFALRSSATFADFGFRKVRPALAVGGVVSAGLSYYIVTALYASAFHLHGNDKLPRELGVSKSTAALVAATVFVCVVAPIAEEFFFRGFLFGVLRRWNIRVAGRDLGTWLAAVVVGILFGLSHAGSASAQYLIPLGFLGFVLCIVRWKTGSLYPCMALHSINNSLALGINQLHWNALEIMALILGSLLVIGAGTVPLARPMLIERRPAAHP
jgi:uncharacterized protein